jgi:dsRNA-specific ribonuclease
MLFRGLAAVYSVCFSRALAIRFILSTVVKMSEHPVEIILQYHFSNRELLEEALLAAGASVSSKDVQGDAQGNKRLALLGDSVLREAVLEPWYSSEESTGECKYVKVC